MTIRLVVLDVDGVLKSFHARDGLGLRLLLDAADWIAPSPGGHGAVRDLCEHLLRDMGHWEAVRARYCD